MPIGIGVMNEGDFKPSSTLSALDVRVCAV
jgi:hypothetical protein